MQVRYSFFVVVLCLAFYSGIYLSPNLWIHSLKVSFPKVPVGSLLSFNDDFSNYLIAIQMLVLPVLIFKSRVFNALAVFLFLVAGLMLVLSDQMRFQPWYYLYSLFVLPLGLIALRGGATCWSLIRLTLSAVYVWAGVSKLNVDYFLYIFPTMMHSQRELILDYPALALLVALMGPTIEITVGVLLLFSKHNKIAILLSFMLHATILLMIGPTGADMNSVIWPWNIAMPLFVVIAFYGPIKPSIVDLVINSKKFFAIALVVLCILPVASLFAYWDAYPGFSLYSGRTAQAKLYLASDNKLESLNFIKKLGAKKSNHYEMDLNAWSFSELNVPVYPESRVFTSVFNTICSQSNYTNDLSMEISTATAFWRTNRKHKRFVCINNL